MMLLRMRATQAKLDFSSPNHSIRPRISHATTLPDLIVTVKKTLRCRGITLEDLNMIYEICGAIQRIAQCGKRALA